MFNGKVPIGGKLPVRRPVPAARGALELFSSTNYTPTILNPVNQAMVKLDRGRTPEIKALRESSPLSPAASYNYGYGRGSVAAAAARRSQPKSKSSKPQQRAQRGRGGGPVGRPRVGKISSRKPPASRARSRQMVDQVRQQASMMTPVAFPVPSHGGFGGAFSGEGQARSRMLEAARQRRSGDFEF